MEDSKNLFDDTPRLIDAFYNEAMMNSKEYETQFEWGHVSYSKPPEKSKKQKKKSKARKKIAKKSRKKNRKKK